jgi:hypothetical protein
MQHTRCIETRHFDVQRERRIYTNNAANRVHYKFHIHEFLSRDFWERHALSLRDIKLILRASSAQMLWMLALFLNFEVTASAIRPCFAELDSIVHGGKTVILKKLNEYSESIWDNDNSDKLTCPGDQHRPLLPVQLLTATEQRYLCTHFTPLRREYEILFRYHGTDYLPYRLYRGHLQLLRVVQRAEYREMFGESSCLRTEPIEFLVNGVAYFDTDESFLTLLEPSVMGHVEPPSVVHRKTDVLYDTITANMEKISPATRNQPKKNVDESDSDP